MTTESDTECDIDNLLENMKNDGSFDCVHSRESIKDYFKGQCDAIESITAQVHKLIICIQQARSKFIEILNHAQSFEDKPVCDKTEH